MKLSFLSNRPNFDRPVVDSLLRHIEGMKAALYSLSNTIRFDAAALNNESLHQTAGAIHSEEFSNQDELRRWGGNKELYDLVVRMAKGELFPLNRREYGLCPASVQQKLKSISCLLELNTETENVYYRTLQGTMLVGKVNEPGSIFQYEKDTFKASWSFVFNKRFAEEIVGTVEFNSSSSKQSPIGFDNVTHQQTGILRTEYGTTSNFHGIATLEIGHPKVYLGGLDSIFVDHDAVLETITKTLPHPSREEILESAYTALEEFRQWLLKAPIDFARTAVDLFNEHSTYTLIRLDGFLSKNDIEENEKTLGEAYKYRLVTCREVENSTEFRGRFTEEKALIYSSSLNDPLPVDFLSPFNGPDEANPDRFKVLPHYTNVALVRLVSGIKDFLAVESLPKVTI